MNGLYDDYQYKILDKRIRMKLIRNEEIQLSPWELSRFVSKLYSYTYKVELISTIAKALTKGVSPEDIFILDESFKLHNSYSKIDILDLASDHLQYLYTIGKPVSLFPNYDIFGMRLLFKVFKKLNERNINSGLERASLSQYYYVMLNEGLKYGISQLINDVDVTEENEKERKKIISFLTKVRSDAHKEIEAYENDRKRIEQIKQQLENSNIKIAEDDEFFQKYFKSFFYYLSKVDRPVIGIYYKKERKIKIICKAHINKNARNATFLDVKEISHNSPLQALIEGGISFFSAVHDEGRKRELHELEMKKKELEIANLQKEYERRNIENETLELEKFKKAIDVHKQIEELEDGDCIKQIGNNFIQNQMASAYKTAQGSCSSLIRLNKLSISPEDVQLVNVEA